MSLAAVPATAQARFGSAVLSAFASTRSGGEVGGRRLDSDVRGLALAWGPEGGGAGLRAGRIGETDFFLGSSPHGAFGRLSSDLTFVGASRTFEAGGWRVGMAVELGRATREATRGILADTGAPARGRDAQAFAETAAAHRERASAALAPGRPHAGGRGGAPAGRRRPRAVGPPDRPGRRLDAGARVGLRPADRRTVDPRAGPRRRPQP